MAKTGGMGDHYYVGVNALGGDIGSLSNAHGGPALQVVTDITQSAESRIGLIRDGGVVGAIWFNPARAHLALRVLPSTDQICTYGIGQAIGNPAFSCIAKQINYDGTRGADGSLTFGVDWQASAGTGAEWGFQATAGIRTDTTATSPATGFDRTATYASTAFGLSAYLHVFAFTGTSVTLTVQDSADNATFATVTGAVFTVVTAATSERITIGTTATVRRYIRVITAGTFSNVQFMVNVVPYEIAQV
jgi:hypothetical protein